MKSKKVNPIPGKNAKFIRTAMGLSLYDFHKDFFASGTEEIVVQKESLLIENGKKEMDAEMYPIIVGKYSELFGFHVDQFNTEILNTDDASKIKKSIADLELRIELRLKEFMAEILKKIEYPTA